MSENNGEVGAVVWQDLSVEDAEGLQSFYSEVTGWRSSPQSMGSYNDFNMSTAGGEVVAGVCHARGENARVPAQWLIYIRVEDVEASARRCLELGGEVLDGPRPMGGNRFCVIRDPAGAVAALISV
jgi:predicted enzyme related to lactoylglutathione lyase